MKKIKRIKQHDTSDCGAACLASVAAYYKFQTPISRIRQMASTDTRGTNVLGMLEAATNLGFTAKGVKGGMESLPKIPLPSIAHVIIKEGLHHFVVLYEYTSKHVKVMDPADGNVHTLTHDDFKNKWSGVLILLLPSQEFKEGNLKTSVFSRFITLVKPHKTVMMQALTGAIIYTILGLSTSIYVQKIVDHVFISANYNLINLMSVIMILLILLQVYIGSVKSIFALKTGQYMDATLILGYYKHIMQLPQKFFDTMRVGEILSRVNDAVKIRVFINDTALGLVVNIFIVVFSFALMFTYYWKLALIILAVIPLYGIVYWITNNVNKRIQRRLMENAAELESHLVESLHAASTIKRFGLESFAAVKTETRFVTLLKSIYTSNTNLIFTGNASELISRLFTVILLWSGTYFVIDKMITPGELLSCYALIGYLTGPASSLIGMNKTIQEALIAADRLFEILDLEREESENKIELSAKMVDDIQFIDVSFRYGSRVTVFENLNLFIPKGKTTAIVGESGSGKSTLMSLLQNMYPVNSGTIKIGDYNIKHISNDSLRKIVSVVPQKVDLFSGNVIDNIAIGEFTPDLERVLKISSELGITDFVEKLPNGFYTALGENGSSLSGGQKQRIAIARALYRKPEILILDEATSSLDTISEQYIQRAIKNLRVNAITVIIIAHRLTTIMNADKIIVLEAGKVVEEGTNEELQLLGKKYYALCENQF
jgi:ABC-type bacteriocin transporter